MKKCFLLFALMMVAAFVPATAQEHQCSGKGNACDGGAAMECCQKKVLVGQQAEAWARENADRLVDNYLAKAGNKLDPDELRKELAEIGYDGTDVPSYRAAERVLVDRAYERMLASAVAAGKTSIILLTGTGGSGKSFSTRTMDFSGEGLLYDSAFNSYKKLSSVIDQAKAAGMTHVKVIAIYNDLITCFKNSIARGKRAKRFLGLKYLIGAFRNNINKISLLHMNYPDVELVTIDNTGNNGGRPVTVEEAEQWQYDVPADLITRMLVHFLHEIDEGELVGQQILSVAGDDYLQIEGMNDTGEALVREIDRRVQAVKQEMKH